MNLNFAQFQRPQRYIGNEFNHIKKNHAEKISICLAYPADYSLGMSNMGLRIVYGLLNEYDNIVCERVFLPGQDLARYLRDANQPLFSLETKTPLNRFQIIAFNLNCEMNCLNMLEMLSLGNIEIFAAQRNDSIVLINGAANPEPFTDFADVFFLGEFEDKAESFFRAVASAGSKQQRLKNLTAIDGFYVPSLPQTKKNITRIHTQNFDTAYFPVRWLVPHTQITHDRVAVEIARGCPNQCAFCQARAVYHPYRIRKPETILRLIKETYLRTGYENFSLLSLSTSDYPGIDSLLDQVLEFMEPRRIGVSLPSLRIDDLLGTLQAKIFRLKKINLTVAIEAASPLLRQNMRKNIDLEKLFAVAVNLRSINIHRIKLYFMFGFFDETQEDLNQISVLLERLRRESKLQINVSLNIFIPKPFSAWQYQPMQDEFILEQKRRYLWESFRHLRGIDVTISQPGISLLEGVLSRGDSFLGKAIYLAWQLQRQTNRYGIDISWNEWKTIFNQQEIDYRQYLGIQEKLPWDFISSRNL